MLIRAMFPIIPSMTGNMVTSKQKMEVMKMKERGRSKLTAIIFVLSLGNRTVVSHAFMAFICTGLI